MNIIFMTFKQLVKYHSHELLITLVNGKEYVGRITTHIFSDEDRNYIQEITLMGDKTIIKINCSDIQKIEKLTK